MPLNLNEKYFYNSCCLDFEQCNLCCKFIFCESSFSCLFFLVGCVEEGYGGLYKASAQEERRKRAAKRRER